TYIVNHAGDQVVLVDHTVWPLYEQLRPATVQHVIVMGLPAPAAPPPDTLAYEALLAAHDPCELEWSDVDERDAAALCYTSGTTGQPKGVLYSHRAIAFHCMNWAMADTVGVRRSDVVLSAPPMFHINGWGLPFVSAMVGATLVLPNRYLDPGSLLELIASEQVTVSAGVPTVWLGVWDALAANPNGHDIRSLRRLATGGSAPPESMMRAWREQYGVDIIHLWGMTEMTASGTVSSMATRPADVADADRYRALSRQGVPEPFIEIRARNEHGLVPWDGTTMGEL